MTEVAFDVIRVGDRPVLFLMTLITVSVGKLVVPVDMA
jgi:hypothetical protein